MNYHLVETTTSYGDTTAAGRTVMEENPLCKLWNSSRDNKLIESIYSSPSAVSSAMVFSQVHPAQRHGNEQELGWPQLV